MISRIKLLKAYLNNESGAAKIIAVIVLVAIAIILAIAFRTQIGDFLQNIWSSISGREDELTSEFDLE
jgi:FlaG/FlaF family flagellin (archaellin)